MTAIRTGYIFAFDSPLPFTVAVVQSQTDTHKNGTRGVASNTCCITWMLHVAAHTTEASSDTLFSCLVLWSLVILQTNSIMIWYTRRVKGTSTHRGRLWRYTYYFPFLLHNKPAYTHSCAAETQLPARPPSNCLRHCPKFPFHYVLVSQRLLQPTRLSPAHMTHPQ